MLKGVLLSHEVPLPGLISHRVFRRGTEPMNGRVLLVTGVLGSQFRSIMALWLGFLIVRFIGYCLSIEDGPGRQTSYTHASEPTLEELRCCNARRHSVDQAVAKLICRSDTDELGQGRLISDVKQPYLHPSTRAQKHWHLQWPRIRLQSHRSSEAIPVTERTWITISIIEAMEGGLASFVWHCSSRGRDQTDLSFSISNSLTVLLCAKVSCCYRTSIPASHTGMVGQPRHPLDEE